MDEKGLKCWAEQTKREPLEKLRQFPATSGEEGDSTSVAISLSPVVFFTSEELQVGWSKGGSRRTSSTRQYATTQVTPRRRLHIWTTPATTDSTCDEGDFRRLRRTPASGDLTEHEQMEKEKMASPHPVIDARFCMSYPVHLILKREKGLFNKFSFSVLDVNGNQLFRVKEHANFVNDDLIILDALDSPVVTIRSKVFAFKDMWTGFRGGSTKENDILFRVKQQNDSSVLNVFMGSDEEESDFDIVGNPPRVYKGDAIVADANSNFSWGGESVKKGGHKIRVHPGMDYAFIVALITLGPVPSSNSVLYAS